VNSKQVTYLDSSLIYYIHTDNCQCHLHCYCSICSSLKTHTHTLHNAINYTRSRFMPYT